MEAVLCIVGFLAICGGAGYLLARYEYRRDSQHRCDVSGVTWGKRRG